MNSIEEFVKHQQTQRQWSVRRSLRRVALRIRRMFKRRLRGESHRQWIERNLKDSEAGALFDIIQCIFSLLMVTSIITQNWSGTSFVRSDANRIIDVANLFAITVGFGLRYYAAANRKAFCLHWLSIVDICCWFPLLVEVIVPDDESRQSKYVYRFFLMIRTLRLLQVFRLRRLAKTAKARQSMLIGLSVISILICAAAAFQTIEYCDYSSTNHSTGVNCQNLSFFDSVYFVCITIGTVGYGELAPKSKMGKIADIFLIIFTGIMIPTQISGLTEILNRETAFDKKYIPDKRIQHILLCGDIENSSLRFFLHTWLHGEGERSNRRKVIILSPDLPTSSVRRILIHREYEQRVTYLQGSAMDANDLLRAGAPSAAYCFVMVSKHSRSLDQDDTATNLLTCSIRKNNRHAPLYVQISKVDNIRHINISGASAVVCMEQLKLAIFAKSLWIRGFNAFLGNMVQRFDVTDDKGGFWLKDYIGGCCQRIYEAAIPSFLFAMPTFRSLATLMYREFNVPLVGIRTLQESVIVYPIDRDLNDIGFHSIFFLSRSRETILKIEKLSNAVFSRHPDISPNVDMSSAKSGRTITNVLANPFQRLSLVLDTNRHSAVSTHGGNSARGPPNGRVGGDKITPMDRDDDAGDSEDFEKGNQPSIKRHKSSLNTQLGSNVTRHPASIRDDDDDNIHGVGESPRITSNGDSVDYSYTAPAKPVIALSPAELMKKATSPVAHPDPASPRLLSPRTIITPRSSRPVATPRSPRYGSQPRPDTPKTPQAHVPATTVTVGPTMSMCESPTTAPMEADCGAVASFPPLDGPLASAIGEALPAAKTSQEARLPASDSPNSAEADGGDVDESKRWKGDNKVGPPILRRISTKRGQQKLHRSSNYRSFTRRAPPTNLCGHFVVCGTPSSYASLIASVNDLGGDQTPVVFVTPRDLSEKDFSAYLEFKSLYFVRGSPVSMEVFDEARMLHAKSILITSYCGQESGQDTRSGAEQIDENMADVDAITTHRFISEACQNFAQKNPTVGPSKGQRTSYLPQSSIPYIVVEMMRPSNVKFLVNRGGGLYDEKSTVNEIRATDLLRDTHALDDAFFSPLYAGGHVYFSNFMDALLGSSSQNAFLIDMLTQLVISGNAGMNQLDRDARSTNRVTQIPAPGRYHNRPYALLVEGLLVNENTIALGIYRAPHGFVAPAYVVTNPPPSEIVHAHDLIFVIK